MKLILIDASGTFIVNKEIDRNLYKLLETYPNNKIILTNATNEEQISKYSMSNMPYEVFTLNHNPNKDDPIYFQKMLEQFNLKAEDCVYFEHSPEAVKSAESVGIKTYYYDSDKKDLDSLKNFLDSNL